MSTRHLRHTAKELEALAQSLHRQADRLDQIGSSRDQAQHHLAALSGLGRTAARLAGYDQEKLDRISADLAADHRINIHTLKHHARQAIKAHDGQSRAERKRQAARLASQGFTNAQIAARFGISTRTVTRDLDAWRRRLT